MNLIKSFRFVIVASLFLALTENYASESNKKHLSGWDALKILKDGNKRFVEGKAKHPDQAVHVRQKLAKGQNPHTIILSCSDSRVPPELVFDQGLGQVFVVRTAGETLDFSAIASIEYAVEHLGTGLIVILGHTACGAVKAALTTAKGQSAGSTDLDKLVSYIQNNLQTFINKPLDDLSLEKPVKANVAGIAIDLVKRSHIVSEFLSQNKLVLAQGIYELATGQVEIFEAQGRSLVNDKHANKKHDADATGHK